MPDGINKFEIARNRKKVTPLDVKGAQPAPEWDPLMRER
jgi:hypothetical protein